jgi:hypothetical protein
MYDWDKVMAAWVPTLAEFPPDLAESPFGNRAIGRLLEILDFRQLRWPGHGLDPNAGFQFVEKEYMQEGEYDAFLHDPTDYIVRTYWPRVFGALESFKGLPPFNNTLTYYMGLGNFGALLNPELEGAWQAIRRAGEEVVALGKAARGYAVEMRHRGFPMLAGSATQVPFDTLGDFFRGSRGSMLDMYRRPDKVIAATDKLLPIMIQMGMEGAKRTGVRRVFIPLHRGSDGFMSEEQFARFYWPGFRDLMLALISEGLTPMVFVEGDYSSRLHFLADVPAGKVCYHFEATPIALAKTTLQGKACVRGGVPLSLLATGTPEAVQEHCRQLIDTVGQGGGYIMDASTTLDDAKAENVRAMFKVAQGYGVRG